MYSLKLTLQIVNIFVARSNPETRENHSGQEKIFITVSSQCKFTILDKFTHIAGKRHSDLDLQSLKFCLQ